MSLVIPRRFRGPDESGNGGWSSGRFASVVPTGVEQPVVSVRLKSPPPLERELDVEETQDGTWRVMAGDVSVAEARAVPGTGLSGIPEPVSFADARRAAAAQAPVPDHPFPHCFTCGPERAEGDGLRLLPALVPGRPDVRAAPWVPSESTPEIVWAALDCPGAWALGAMQNPMVLGTIAAEVLDLPAVGEQHVVIGWPIDSQGRKHHCGTAVYAGERLVARARSTWIAVDPTTVRPA